MRVCIIDSTLPHPALYSGGSDKKVNLWNYDEGSKYYVGEGHSGSVCKVRISPDEQRIISVGTEGGIFIWRVPNDFANP